MIKPFKTFTGKVAPLPRIDVDTDQIIAARFLTAVSREGFGANLFASLREQDPSFPLDRVEYQGATVLITDSNFGCGSSREHAVWAIQDAGFGAVIAPSFADIFSSNASKNGLLLITLPHGVVAEFLGRSEPFNLTVDLERQLVTEANGTAHLFEYDPFRKHCLIQGLDDLDYILSKREEIDSFFANQHGYFVQSEGENR